MESPEVPLDAPEDLPAHEAVGRLGRAAEELAHIAAFGQRYPLTARETKALAVAALETERVVNSLGFESDDLVGRGMWQDQEEGGG